MLHLEGHGDGRLQGCMSCSSADGFYHCEDCVGGILECHACCLWWHHHLPLHIIQVRVVCVWMVQFWLTTAAMEPALLQKNHAQGNGTTCATQAHGFCLPDSEARLQGLHSPSHERLTLCCNRFLRLWPPHNESTTAAQNRLVSSNGSLPTDLCNIRLFELFHTVTLTGKLSAHKFYKALKHLTDYTGLNVPKVSQAFLCMIKIDITFSDTL